MKNPIEPVRSILALTPDRWQGLTLNLPPALLNSRPAPAEWSAVECLQHLVDTERVFQFRVECFLAGADFPSFDPDRDGANSDARMPEGLSQEFTSLREESLRMIDKLTEEDLECRVRHQELGPVILGEMLAEWAAHDLDHTIQAERTLMQPLLLDCGPWIRYYLGHVILER